MTEDFTEDIKKNEIASMKGNRLDKISLAGFPTMMPTNNPKESSFKVKFI